MPLMYMIHERKPRLAVVGSSNLRLRPSHPFQLHAFEPPRTYAVQYVVAMPNSEAVSACPRLDMFVFKRRRPLRIQTHFAQALYRHIGTSLYVLFVEIAIPRPHALPPTPPAAPIAPILPHLLLNHPPHHCTVGPYRLPRRSATHLIACADRPYRLPPCEAIPPI